MLRDAERRLLHAVPHPRPLRDDGRIDGVDDVTRVGLNHRQRRRLGREARVLRGGLGFGHRGRQQPHVHRRAVETVHHVSDVGLDHVGLTGQPHVRQADGDQRDTKS